MKKSLNKITALLLMLMMCVMMLPLSANAAQPPVTVELPVSIQVTGDIPDPAEEYTVRLTPAEDAPMPYPGEAYHDIVITGSGSDSFPEITYEKVGIYQYTIQQIAGTHPRGVYDASVYDVTVTITNSEDGQTLESTVAIRKGDDKFDTAEFVNDYTLEITVYKVWDDEGATRPESVRIDLIADGKVVESAILSKENNWTYTWQTSIKAGTEWSVQENPIPGKYHVSYNYDGNTATVTNKYTPGLIQTGQLNWPIWVMGGAGLMLIAFGAVVLAKKNRELDA